MCNRVDLKTKLVGESKIVIVLLTVMLGLVATTLTQNSASAAELFSDAPAYAQLEAELEQALEDPTIVRIRPVLVNLDLLTGDNLQQAEDDRPAGDNVKDAADSITLNLFDDLSLVAVKDRLERRSATIYTWFGSIEGVRLGSAIIVVADGSVAANITVDAQMYQVRNLGDGIHAIREIDQSMFPDESPPIEVPLAPGPPLDPAFQGDDGSIIDVMVVYTDELAQQVPGLAAEILLAIDETNQSYANSGITQRISLVHTEQVTYTESDDLCTDLGRLRATSDGYMDNVHTLRDQYCADCVSLWTWCDGCGTSCGCGYHMDPVSSTFESWAFSVVRRDCATGYYSFGHELGHNMAARHDCYKDSSVTPYPYNHGYVCHSEQVRTIMAYNTECADSGYNCTRIQYWSNPNTAYGTCPVLGVPESGSTCTSENFRTLDNTAPTVANFRDSTVCVPIGCTPPPCTPAGDEYCSTDVPKTITSNATLTSTLTIAQACTIADLNVELDITHTYDADLDVYLIGPDGTRVELFTDVGGGGDNFECTVLDDEAATSITAGAAPFTDCYQPEAGLADFDGKDLTGTWTLEITDDATGDAGTLNSWCLIVECGGCDPPPRPTCPDPGDGATGVPVDTLLSWDECDCEIIDDFEDGDIAEYTVQAGDTHTVTAAAAHDGSYGLEDSNPTTSGKWIWRDDAAAQVAQGDTISYWVKMLNNPDFARAYCGFGASAAGTYALVPALNPTPQLIIMLVTGYGIYADLATVPQAWTLDKWYRVEVQWDVGGDMTGRVYDSDGTTLLNTVTANDTTYSQGGIALRGFEHVYQDTFERCGAADSIASLSLTPGHPAGKVMPARDPADAIGWDQDNEAYIFAEPDIQNGKSGASPSNVDIDGTLGGGQAEQAGRTETYVVSDALDMGTIELINPAATYIAGSGPSNARGLFLSSSSNLTISSVGFLVETPAGLTLTANLYSTTGPSVRGALLTSNTVTTSGSGKLWHDVPLSYVLQAAVEYDLEFAQTTNFTSWDFLNDTVDAPFTVSGVTALDGENAGDASNLAMGKFRLETPGAGGPDVIYAAATTTAFDFGAVNKTTGLFSAIGPTGEAMQGLAYDRNTDTVYATTFAAGPSTAVLVTIDQSTGALTPIGETGVEDIHGLAFDPENSTLYGISSTASTSQLYTINTSNGSATQRGSAVSGTLVGGIAFDPGSSTLYGADDYPAGGTQLVTIDTTTGAHTVVGPLGVGIVDVDGLAYSQQDSRLYAIDDTTENTLSINPATGAASPVGTTGTVWGATYGLTCKPAAGCPTIYDVYLGASPGSLSLICQDLPGPPCTPQAHLAPCTTHYWKVVAKNCCGQTEGPIWSFTTAGCGTCWNPNECACQTDGDCSCDGWVNLADLFCLKQYFGRCAPWTDPDCCADFNHDGCVNLGDLFVLKAYFGAGPCSPSTGNQTCP